MPARAASIEAVVGTTRPASPVPRFAAGSRAGRLLRPPRVPRRQVLALTPFALLPFALGCSAVGCLKGAKGQCQAPSYAGRRPAPERPEGSGDSKGAKAPLAARKFFLVLVATIHVYPGNYADV